MKNSAMSRPLYEVDPQIANTIDNEAAGSVFTNQSHGLRADPQPPV